MGSSGVDEFEREMETLDESYSGGGSPSEYKARSFGGV